MKPFRGLIAGLLTCCVLACSVGCTTTRMTVPAGDPTVPAFGKIKRFDNVEVETGDDQRVRFVVGAVERDAIISEEGVRYTRADIVQVRHKTVNGWRTLSLVMVLMVPGAGLGGELLGALGLLLGAAIAAAIGG